jgi:hypothetical protein
VKSDTENAKRGDVRDFFGSSRIINENKDVKVAIPDTENSKRGGSGGLLEEDEYMEVATEVADYMLSDVKVINFSAYAYRG